MSDTFIYREDYHGFIYVWYDRVRKMMYIGSHMGSVDDGYICSSIRMKKAYRRRPSTFMRRILYWSKTPNHAELLEKEKEWLGKISPDELGVRFYNLCMAFPPPMTEKLKQTISKKTKEMWKDEERSKKHREGMSRSWTPERKAAHAEKMRKKWAEGGYRQKLSESHSESFKGDPTRREKVSEASKKMHARFREEGRVIHTDEVRAKMSASAKERANDPEWKAKFTEWATGRSPSSDTRAKLSRAALGRKLTPEHAAKIRATNVSTWSDPGLRGQHSLLIKSKIKEG